MQSSYLDEDIWKLGAYRSDPPALAPDGTIFFGWSEIMPDRSSRYLLTNSTDGGQTWRAPKTVLQSSSPIMNPTLAVAPNGDLGLLFYDFRNDVPGDNEATADVWFARAKSPYGLGTWKTSHLGGPFGARTIPVDSDIGSRQGNIGIPGGFAVAFTMARPAAQIGPTTSSLRKCWRVSDAIGTGGWDAVTNKTCLVASRVSPSRITSPTITAQVYRCRDRESAGVTMIVSGRRNHRHEPG